MPPTILFIRHAQARHNVDAPFNFHLHDPQLSEQGVEQCKVLQQHLRERLPFAEKINLIVTSPFRRTLQTTEMALEWLIQAGVPVVPRAEWQGMLPLIYPGDGAMKLKRCNIAENSDKPCDSGSDIASVAQEYPNIDFASVDPLYPAKTGLYAYTKEAVIRRGAAGLSWLRARPEAYIAVVTHSAFLRTAVAHRRFANADYRVFEFSDDPDTVDLVELSGEAGGMGRSAIGLMGIEAGDFEEDEDEDEGDEGEE